MNDTVPAGLGDFGPKKKRKKKTSEVKVSKINEHVNECDFTDEMKLGTLLANQSLEIDISEDSNYCTVIFNNGEVLMDLTNPISAPSASFISTTTRLMEQQTACKVNVTKTNKLYFHNLGKAVVISLIFE